MKSRYLILSVALVFMAGSAAATNYTYEEKMYYGDTLELQDYEISYKTQQGDPTLTIGKWADTSFLIIEEIDGIDIYESEGKKLDISGDIEVRIAATGYDEDGNYINLSITGPEDIFSSGEITTTAPDKIIIEQGESAQIPITLSNDGFLDKQYNLSADTDASFTTSFGYQDFNVSNVFVESEEEAEITSTVEVPETAELGVYDLKLNAINGTTLSENFRIEVRGREVEKELNLDLDERYKQSSSGQTVEVGFVVSTGGGYYVGPREPEGQTLNNVTFDVQVPEGWNYELSPERVNSLEPGNRRSVRLSVEVPENADPGDFFVELSSSSNEASIEEPERIRVNIDQRSGMGIIGGSLMVFSLGILVLVYRKFGRR